MRSRRGFFFSVIHVVSEEEEELKDKICCCGIDLKTSCTIISIFQIILDLFFLISSIFILILHHSINLVSYLDNFWTYPKEDREDEIRSK